MQYVIIVRHISGNIAYLGLHKGGRKHAWVSMEGSQGSHPFLFSSVHSATTWLSSHVSAYETGSEVITLDEFNILRVMFD